MKITPKQYAQVLYDLTDGKSKSEIERSVADFACHIYKEGELKLADKIIGQFSKIYDRKNGIVEASIATAEKISDSTEKKLKDYIEKKYNAKKTILNNIVDESIKSGFVLRVGDEVMDGSVAGRLEELRKILV
jgi:F-type H+-transporting ATPase subunit delta